MKTKRFIGMFIALIMTIGLLTMIASAEVVSGSCGDNVTWAYDTATQTLTISGTGEMKKLAYSPYEYNSYAADVKRVIVEEGVTSIGYEAFYCFTCLESIVLPESLTTIEDKAFYLCKSLKTITIPYKVSMIGGNSFFACDALEFIEVDDANPTYSSDENGVLYNKEKTILFKFPSASPLTSFTVPTTVLTIEEYAVIYCKTLAKVSMPSVTTIGDSAFYGSKVLTEISLPNVTTIGRSAFYNCDQLTEISLPNVTTIGESAFYNCDQLTEISLPNVTTIGESTFYSCDQLTEISLPNITTINSHAFNGCKKLTKVSLPNVTTIGGYAFYSCDELAEVSMPSVITIGDYAFFNCTKLAEVSLAAVTSIAKSTFDRCTSLSTVHYLGTEADWSKINITSYGNRYIVNAMRHYCTEGEGKEATCSEEGKKGDWYCSVCGDTVLIGEKTALNPDNHTNDFINGICSCGNEYEEPTLAGEYYQIENAGQLFWFAQQVNEVGNREINGILTDDIDLEDRPWTPIGTTGENNNNYRGVFDGDGHTIRGLNVTGEKSGVGFFGEVRTGTIKNFTIYGEVTVSKTCAYVGGVVGSACGVNVENDLERNGATIQNITSYVNLTTTAHGVGRVGGFMGYSNHETLVENCAWYGTFDLGGYRSEAGAGGFIGRVQENSNATIRNCVAYGTIKTNYKKGSYNNSKDIFIGGFTGWSVQGSETRPTNTVIENCLFAGEFELGEDITDMIDYSAFGCLAQIKSIKNCYYLGENGLLGVNNNSTYKPTQTELVSVEKAQLASGEVAYKLGSAFGQDLSDGNSLPVLGGMEVYKVYLCDGTTESYSNSNENKSHIDENSNCECDVCEETVHTDNDNTCTCDICETQLRHVNTNQDFVCDICNGSLIEKTEIKGFDKETGRVTIAFSAPDSYTIFIIDYEGDKLNNLKMLTVTRSKPIEESFTIPSDISLGKDDKIMVVDSDTFAPFCEEFVVG